MTIPKSLGLLRAVAFDIALLDKQEILEFLEKLHDGRKVLIVVPVYPEDLDDEERKKLAGKDNGDRGGRRHRLLPW